MKKSMLKKWVLRATATGFFILFSLIGIALNPMLLYAHSTDYRNYIICHQQQLDPVFILRVNDANKLISSAELFDRSLKRSICLNDGSVYPLILRILRGEAFGYGFGKNVVLAGCVNARANYVEINGYKWNLTELIAHESVHCYEFHHCGLLHSNPIGNIPAWKWEGYAEYVARKRKAHLVKNIAHLIETEKQDNNNWIGF